MIVQAVSTSSGSIVSSTTTVVKTYAEAAGQAEPMAEAILRHSGRILAQLDEPHAEPSDTPKPSASAKGNEANLTGLGGLFHRKPKATEAPSPAAGATVALPSPAQVAVAAGSRVLVLQVGGDAGQSLAERAAGDITAAANRYGSGAQTLPVSAVDGVAHAADFCRANAGTHALYAGTLTLQRNDAGQATGAQVDVVVYDCAGNVVERRHGDGASGRGGIDAAIDRAVNAAFATAPKGRS